MPPLSDTEALNRIHECLNGLEWSADTLEAIAALIEATGRPIAPPPMPDRRRVRIRLRPPALRIRVSTGSAIRRTSWPTRSPIRIVERWASQN